jgi:DNA modification methylase
MPELTWIGKGAVVRHHADVPFRLLEEVKELSCPPTEGDTENLIVQGDNLEALKALLPRYAGKVKCIYIDPPYNTGNEGWVYNDAVNSPEIRQWLGAAVGKEAEDLSRHDKWLCMMYPRLVLLHQFLREDGLIFVSIDENEHRYAELMLDEIFGSVNRMQTLVWKKSYGGGAKSKHIVNLHEYVLSFAKSKARIPVLNLPPDESVLRYYKYRDAKFEFRGPYRLQPLATNSMDARPNLRYAIPFQGEEIWPEKQWQWAPDRALAALAADELAIAKRRGKWVVNYKQYLRDEEGEERASKLYSIIDKVYTQQGTNEIEAIFGDGKAFSFPKPPALVRLLLSLATSPGDLILDSFAGSGTTGHAVLQLNQQNEAEGNRRFILVEIDAKIAADITAERVRRVAQGYTNAKGEAVPGLGGGFTFARLGKPLFDEHGAIHADVTFAELAEFVFFRETGRPLPKSNRATRTALLGTHDGRAVYLLFNGILADRSANGGNVLTGPVIFQLPPHDAPKVIYAAACRLGRARLESERITFKQTPYDLQIP